MKKETHTKGVDFFFGGELGIRLHFRLRRKLWFGSVLPIVVPDIFLADGAAASAIDHC